MCNEPIPAVRAAERIVHRFGTRDADRLAEELGVCVVPCRFKRQKGVYKVIERSRFVFIKDDLEPVMHSIVLLHELGHDTLHRGEAVRAGGFQELDIFAAADRRMEHEANMFAAQISLPDDEFIEYVCAGYGAQEIARAMCSDVNLVALKARELRRRGLSLRVPRHCADFLK